MLILAKITSILANIGIFTYFFACVIISSILDAFFLLLLHVFFRFTKKLLSDHNFSYAKMRKKRIFSYPVSTDCITTRSVFKLFETNCITRRSDKNIVISSILD